MINAPLHGFWDLQAFLRELKSEIRDEALAELKLRLSGSFTASGQISASALGGVVPTTALPPIQSPVAFLGNWSNDISSTLGFLIAALQFEDDFDDDALDVGWLDTDAGSADYVSETDTHGYLWLEHSAAAERGIYRVVTPAADMTFVAKLSYSLPATNAYLGFALTDSADTPLATATVQRTAGGVQARTGASGGTSVALPGFYYSDTVYLLLLKSGTDYVLMASKHGFYTWETIASFTQAGTVARLRLVANGDGGSPQSAVAFVDFVRVYDTQSTTIGGLP